MDTWKAIHAERAALADALAAVPDDEWSRPTLCSDWTMRMAVAHLISTTQINPPTFFGRLIASGFRFQAMLDANIRRVLAGEPSNADLVALYRSRAQTRTAPPGPTMSWLGETIVHGEDIFRARGGYRDHPVEHVTAVADFYAGSNLLIGTKNRIDGLRLRATDTDWSHGAGPEVAGPAIAVLMAMTGRKPPLDDLTGPGVATLASRA